MAPVSQAKKKMAGKKPNGKSVLKIADHIQSLAEGLRKQVSKQVDGVGSKAKKRSAGFAVSLVKFQRSAVDKAFKILTKVQERSDQVIEEYIEDAEWLPAEGKDIVKEWNRILSDGRAEFQKTVDKSYDLMCSYLERVKKTQKVAGKGAAKSAFAGKKRTVAKKAASKPKSVPEASNKM